MSNENTSRCIVCGRPLRSAEAMKHGMGSSCAKKFAQMKASGSFVSGNMTDMLQQGYIPIDYSYLTTDAHEVKQVLFNPDEEKMKVHFTENDTPCDLNLEREQNGIFYTLEPQGAFPNRFAEESSDGEILKESYAFVPPITEDFRTNTHSPSVLMDSTATAPSPSQGYTRSRNHNRRSRYDYTPEERNRYRDEKVNEAFEKIQNGVAEFQHDPERLRAFLEFQSKFHHYSINNNLLILIQKPNATRVAGFQKWKELGRHVKKGEKGISILAPIIVKDRETDEETVVGFKTVTVFDVSQTDGKPLKNTSLLANLRGVTEGKLEHVIAKCPFPVEFKDTGDANGFFDLTNKKIALSNKVEERQQLKTLAHEWGHGLLHQKDTDGARLDPAQKEIEAEAVAYSVCHAMGVDSSEYSFGYIKHWGQFKNEDVQQRLLQSAERIRHATHQILSALEN